MGGASRRIYPKANTTAQWWEGAFSRGTFSRIEKILLHTTETTGWPGYKAGASAPTLTYHPRQRAWRQHNYLDRSARALVDPTGTTVRENRDNVIQIEVIAYSDERVAATVGGLKVSQLTDAHYRDLAEFVAWVRREWGGPPLRAPEFIAYPGSYGNSRVRMSGPEYDAYQGLIGHQHASGNDHGDPSNIDAQKILRMVREIEGTTPSPAPVTQEDDMPTPTELWRADVIPAPDPNPANPTWQPDSYLRETFRQARAANERAAGLEKAVATIAGQVAGLVELVKQQQGDGDVDLAAVQAASKAGAQEALAGYSLTLEPPTPEA